MGAKDTNEKHKNMPAILGGPKAVVGNIAPYVTLGDEEKLAVNAVMDSGVLSGFIGACCPEFYGGPMVQKLERDWESFFGVKHAVSMNSATSCLYASIGALGISPGDEVIVTPTTMTATITGIVLYQAVPIFVDISEDTLCIDHEKIEEKITTKTKAIIGVDIYGATADWDEIVLLAKKYNLAIIEDSAQSIGGLYKGKKSGTLADIGVYSLNRHKHIHCGEGGVCVTNDDDLANRLRLIRNHGEAVVDDMRVENIGNIIGFNYRMTELEAAIAIEQLKKLDYFVDQRVGMCHKIIKEFSNFRYFALPHNSENEMQDSTFSKNVYYYLCFKVKESDLGMSLDSFLRAMNAEGVPVGKGGYLPVYLQAMFQSGIAFSGESQHNFSSTDYNLGLCPVAERMWFEELFYIKVQNFVPTDIQIKQFGYALKKVLGNKSLIVKHLNND